MKANLKYSTRSLNAPALAVSQFRAFTLIEMLLVMTIMGILLAVAAPVTSSVLNANQITTSTQMLVDQLSLARQTALARNRVVEVRFYKFAAADRQSTDGEVAAMESFIYDAGNTIATPLGEVKVLPDGAVIREEASLSSLVQSNRLKTDWSTNDPQRELPGGINGSYSAYRLRFRPDGSTDLGAGSWFLTVTGTRSAGAPPPNYATIQVDSHNGSLRLYRPS